MGNWWIYEFAEQCETSSSLANGHLRRIPNGREDIFADKSINIKSKRALIKFLRVVADPETQDKAIKEHGSTSFDCYLTREFGLALSAQAALHALTLSPDPPNKTKTSYALPRIFRHVASFGVFGPGFNAVIPKWGGLAEVAQIGCRAGAVGGAVYMLGKGIESVEPLGNAEESPKCAVKLQNGETVSARHVAGGINDLPTGPSSLHTEDTYVVRSLSVVSSSLSSLFSPLADGPTPAGSVIVFPSGAIADVPVYLTVHSSETGECPSSQCKSNISRFPFFCKSSQV